MKLSKRELASDFIIGCYFCLAPASYVIGSHMAQRNLFLCKECSKEMGMVK